MAKVQNSRPPLTKSEVLAFVVGLVAAVMLIERASSHWMAEAAQPIETHSTRQVLLDSAPKDFPRPEPGTPSLWIVGNSHVFGLPGIKKGDPLRLEVNGALVDELSSRIDDHRQSHDVLYYRLAYPNYLPFEMLISIARLRQLDHHPRVVVLGLSWTNLARSRDPRTTMRDALRDRQFAAYFAKLLRDPNLSISPQVHEEFEENCRQIEADERQQQTLSHADKLETVATHWLGERITLIGKSEDLRARLYRSTVMPVQDALAGETLQYGVVESDLRFNVSCLVSVFRLLSEMKASVMIYVAPARSDLPAYITPERERQVLEQIEAEAEKQGFVWVDASNVVPNEYWGWSDNVQDRAHFVEPGHQRLAQFLFEAGAKRGLWEKLSTPQRASAK